MMQFAVSFPASPDAWAIGGAKRNDQSGATGLDRELYHFSTQGNTILIAGSRHLKLEETLCYDLLSALSGLGAHFITGCAKGVDRSIREALIDLNFLDRSFVGCAFNGAVEMMDLPAKKVVASGLKPAAALAARTRYLVNEASLVILFPSFPSGPGSALAFKTSVQKNRPLFLVQENQPPTSPDYHACRSSLFGLITGWWVLPCFFPSRGFRAGRRVKPGKRPEVAKPKKVIDTVKRAVASDPLGVL